MYTFVHTLDDLKITMSQGDEKSLDDMLESFAAFLRACGYSFDGELQVVDESAYTSVEEVG